MKPSPPDRPAEAEARHAATDRLLERWATPVDPDDAAGCELLLHRAADRHGYPPTEVTVTVTAGRRQRTYHG